MSRSILLGVIGSFLLACGGAGGEPASEGLGEEDLTVGAGTDIQVVSAKVGSTAIMLDPVKCTLSDKVQREMNGFTGTAKADCTDAAAAALGAPLVSAFIEPQMSIREDPKFVAGSMRHWCAAGEVRVAVKAAVFDASNFKGIGFYGYDAALNQPESQRILFYKKNDKRLVRAGDAILKDGGAKVYLFKFASAGPCAENGTGDNPSHKLAFKPFVRFGSSERWESVPADHTVGISQSWDRGPELLR